MALNRYTHFGSNAPGDDAEISTSFAMDVVHGIQKKCSIPTQKMLSIRPDEVYRQANATLSELHETCNKIMSGDELKGIKTAKAEHEQEQHASTESTPFKP